MAEDYQPVDNLRGYAYVALTRAYEKQRSFGWFAALVRVRATPAKYDWVREGLARWDARCQGVRTETAARELISDIIKVMSKEIYDDNKHRIRSVGPRGRRRYVVVDVPTDPTVAEATWQRRDAVRGEPNPVAEAAVARMREVPKTAAQQAVFDWIAAAGYTDYPAMAAELGLPYGTVRGAVTDLRRKFEKLGIRN